MSEKKTEPVLTPEEWARVRSNDPEFPTTSDESLNRKMIALANYALPGSDRRKITRGDVLSLREYAKRLMGLARANCERIADVLESYLPPAPK